MTTTTPTVPPTLSTAPVPALLPDLVADTNLDIDHPVRVRPRSWERAVGPEAAASLHDPALVTPTTDDRFPGDVDLRYRDVLAAGAALDLTDPLAMRRQLVAVVAWGSGTTNTRALRHTRAALDDPRLDTVLASTVRLCRSDDPAALEDAYEGWQVQGIGRSFFTKWFAAAGRVPDRPWQPLVLDDRVLAALNDVLAVTTVELATLLGPPSGARRWSRRYRAYVQAVHGWADALGTDADRVAGALFRHGRGAWEAG